MDATEKVVVDDKIEYFLGDYPSLLEKAFKNEKGQVGVRGCFVTYRTCTRAVFIFFHSPCDFFYPCYVVVRKR